ncbi:MAG: hypothetical protein J3K34DRAFT_276657 [Monoraphidium minutum]|nr:MAG: hypothetical protein J3K34DRAFT_276657 [Monoraphidium minutum]
MVIKRTVAAAAPARGSKAPALARAARARQARRVWRGARGSGIKRGAHEGPAAAHWGDKNSSRAVLGGGGEQCCQQPGPPRTSACHALAPLAIEFAHSPTRKQWRVLPFSEKRARRGRRGVGRGGVAPASAQLRAIAVRHATHSRSPRLWRPAGGVQKAVTRGKRRPGPTAKVRRRAERPRCGRRGGGGGKPRARARAAPVGKWFGRVPRAPQPPQRRMYKERPWGGRGGAERPAAPKRLFPLHQAAGAASRVDAPPALRHASRAAAHVGQPRGNAHIYHTPRSHAAERAVHLLVKGVDPLLVVARLQAALALQRLDDALHRAARAGARRQERLQVRVAAGHGAAGGALDGGRGRGRRRVGDPRLHRLEVAGRGAQRRAARAHDGDALGAARLERREPRVARGGRRGGGELVAALGLLVERVVPGLGEEIGERADGAGAPAAIAAGAQVPEMSCCSTKRRMRSNLLPGAAGAYAGSKPAASSEPESSARQPLTAAEQRAATTGRGPPRHGCCCCWGAQGAGAGAAATRGRRAGAAGLRRGGRAGAGGRERFVWCQAGARGRRCAAPRCGACRRREERWPGTRHAFAGRVWGRGSPPRVEQICASPCASRFTAHLPLTRAPQGRAEALCCMAWTAAQRDRAGNGAGR